MKRKHYEKPMTQVILLEQCQQLLSGSPEGSLPESQSPIDDDWE